MILLFILWALSAIGMWIFFMLYIIKEKQMYNTLTLLCIIIFLFLLPKFTDLKRNSKHYTISTEIRQKIINGNLIKSDTIYIIKNKI